MPPRTPSGPSKSPPLRPASPSRPTTTGAAPAQRLKALEAAETPERPVEVAPVADGVHVRAYEDRRSPGVPPLPPSEEVSGGVLADGEPGRLPVRGDAGLGPPRLWAAGRRG